ncbi:unnamed protein product [Durusdinium trenchii]|uniref:Secreted protein n=1 Tax=Durusdinium trenchii TaxID=1381693 RepID=A0ABP0P0Y0_9DINO
MNGQIGNGMTVAVFGVFVFITELFCAYCQTTEELIWSAADAEVLPPMKLARWKLQPEAKQKATAHRAVPKPKQSTNSTKPSKKSSKIVKAKVGKGGKVIKKPASASASSSSKTAQK